MYRNIVHFLWILLKYMEGIMYTTPVIIREKINRLFLKMTGDVIYIIPLITRLLHMVCLLQFICYQHS